MYDEARERGLRFDFAKLESFFGAPIVKTVANKKAGLDALQKTIHSAILHRHEHGMPKLSYGKDVDDSIQAVVEAIDEKNLNPSPHIPSRFFAIKLLEQDSTIPQLKAFNSIMPVVKEQIEHLKSKHSISPETVFADCRYGMINGACREAVSNFFDEHKRQELSDKIDRFVLSPILGLPIFFVLMYLMFQFGFTCAAPFSDLIATGLAELTRFILRIWPAETLPFFRSMLTEGILGGVGGVLTFLPNIVFLFLAIAFLEGIGYMARAAFVMDGAMHKFGLHGKSFIPLLLGFGCSVPAIMATRSIESRKDRLTTILIIPFMSCGGRLTIFAMMIPAFIQPRYQALVMWLLYLIGVLFALAGSLLLKKTLFKGDGEIFVMELPPYRMPTWKAMLTHMGLNAWMYVQKAGTFVLGASIVLFILNNYPVKQEFSKDYAAEIAAVSADSTLSQEEKEKNTEHILSEKKAESREYSFSGRIGKGMEHVLHTAGFDWKASSALLGAVAAKELFVAQLGILYAAGDKEDSTGLLQNQIRTHYTPLQGFCILLFCLLYFPCFGTMAIVKKETGSWFIAIGQAVGYTIIAFITCFIVYQVGSFLKIGTTILGS